MFCLEILNDSSNLSRRNNILAQITDFSLIILLETALLTCSFYLAPKIEDEEMDDS